MTSSSGSSQTLQPYELSLKGQYRHDQQGMELLAYDAMEVITWFISVSVNLK